LTLKIKPVKLNKSIYVRVPNDIADLIGLDQLAELIFNLEDNGDEFSLIYSAKKKSSGQSVDSNAKTEYGQQTPLAKTP